ncbi:MAG: hypothetical protein Q8R82_20965 [Hyphomonadaceae bacterium]|nr:hypothetical protein [Hyphomonadaceae bacterium]
MKSLRFSLCAAAISLAACAPTEAPADDATFKTATAEAVPGLDPATVAISNAKRASAKWTWDARAGAKTYSCDADDRMRLPSCVVVA